MSDHSDDVSQDDLQLPPSATAEEVKQLTPEINKANTITDVAYDEGGARMSVRARIIALILLGILLIIAGVVISMINNRSATNRSATKPTPKQQIKEQESVSPELSRFIKPTTGEVWHETPKTMSPQGWLKQELPGYYSEESDAEPLKYFEVGARDGSKIILVEHFGGFTRDLVLFEKRTDDKVYLIQKPQARFSARYDNTEYYKDLISDKVTGVDLETSYDSLNIPETISIGNDEVVSLSSEQVGMGYLRGNIDAAGVVTKKILDLGSSRLVRTEVAYADTNLTNIGYQVELPFGSLVNTTYLPNGDSLEGFSFANGAKTKEKYPNAEIYDGLHAIARGCGLIAASVTRSDSVKIGDLSPIGKTAAGRTVYEPRDENNELYQKAYEEYKMMGGTAAKSFEDYRKDHGLMFIENNQAELLVYVRESYSAAGGCAKPVVYLYPTKTTSVDVVVGADVKISDPLYPEGGWRDVIAQPNGQLSYLGGTYDSLFWEGQGHGSYPAIQSGTVVKRSEAVATIRRQLVEQGLNQKEIADFMDFWTDKIPDKPYIRLTWLTKAQLDELAPLRISPKPDTVIRVFLDMDGFNQPPKLPAQKLTSIPRQGFTAVEWGGLSTLPSQQ